MIWHPGAWYVGADAETLLWIVYEISGFHIKFSGNSSYANRKSWMSDQKNASFMINFNSSYLSDISKNKLISLLLLTTVSKSLSFVQVVWGQQERTGLEKRPWRFRFDRPLGQEKEYFTIYNYNIQCWMFYEKSKQTFSDKKNLFLQASVSRERNEQMSFDKLFSFSVLRAKLWWRLFNSFAKRFTLTILLWEGKKTCWRTFARFVREHWKLRTALEARKGSLHFF